MRPSWVTQTIHGAAGASVFPKNGVQAQTRVKFFKRATLTGLPTATTMQPVPPASTFMWFLGARRSQFLIRTFQNNQTATAEWRTSTKRAIWLSLGVRRHVPCRQEAAAV